jgi:hypothetical protein
VSDESPSLRVARSFAADLAGYTVFWVPVVVGIAVAVGDVMAQLPPPPRCCATCPSATTTWPGGGEPVG